MSRVVITLTDTPDGTTIQPTLRYPEGKVGSDQSFAEAVAEDFLLMLQGRFQDFQLEYSVARKQVLRLVRGGKS